ncbi:MAG: class I SAM-dependent methyltransferase [Terriglobales bacterium]
MTRRSSGLLELTRALAAVEGAHVLDLGPTSPQNISYFTGLAQKIYNEDVLLASRVPALLVETEEGKRIDIERFLAENLVYEKGFFDVVFCWDLADYLDASLVKPVVQRIHSVMKPKGLLLAFFHTRDAGPDAPYHRYHIAGKDTLEMQRIPAPMPGRESAPSGAAVAQTPAYGRLTHFRLQRVFNNRHIENLFHDYGSIKFFLGRDNIREVLVVR